jgi:hypothetical protein
MHRQTQYAYEVPSETDFLYASRFAYEGLGLLAMDLLGTSSLVSGLACAPTGPASMAVTIAPGRIYSKQNLDDTAWGQLASFGGLAADVTADHQILKQGILRDTTTLATMAAPGTTGQSINYLVQAAFSTVDAVPLSLPFVSATAPYPPIAPQNLNTVRKDSCVITVKAGTAAATGSQTTPAVDSGNVGLWVVTVANGQTSITSGNITAYSGAPFITETLTQKISQAFGDARYLQVANGRIRLTANTTFYVSTTGNDTTGDGSVANPFRTAQKASDLLQQKYDLAGFVATIARAGGTYTDGVVVKGRYLGAAGKESVVFDIVSTSVTVSSTASCYLGQDGAAFTVKNQTLSSGSGYGIISIGSSIAHQGNNFGICANAHLCGTDSGFITSTGPYTVSGNAPNHILASVNGCVSSSVLATLTGTPAFSSSYAGAAQNGTINAAGSTFTGSATGLRYAASTNGVIDTNTGGASFFPGSTPGTTTTGGQYN